MSLYLVLGHVLPLLNSGLMHYMHIPPHSKPPTHCMTHLALPAHHCSTIKKMQMGCAVGSSTP